MLSKAKITAGPGIIGRFKDFLQPSTKPESHRNLSSEILELKNHANVLEKRLGDSIAAASEKHKEVVDLRIGLAEASKIMLATAAQLAIHSHQPEINLSSDSIDALIRQNPLEQPSSGRLSHEIRATAHSIAQALQELVSNSIKDGVDYNRGKKHLKDPNALVEENSRLKEQIGTLRHQTRSQSSLEQSQPISYQVHFGLENNKLGVI